MLVIRRFSLLLLLVFFLTGCVDIELKTTVHPDGSGTQSWKFTTTALLAGQVKKQVQSDPFFSKNKTRFLDEFKEGDYILVADVDFKAVGDLQDKYREIHFDKEGLFRSTYTYSETWKQNLDGNGIIARNSGGLVPVTLKIAIAMPGRIIDSNAQSIDSGVAKWSLTVSELAQPKTFRVVSRRWNFVLLIPALLVLAGLIAALILLVVLRSSRKPAIVPAVSTGQTKCLACGSAVPPNSLFCNVCGAKLN